MRFALRYLEAHPGAPGWMQWYFILRGGGADGRVAIGNGGFKGKPEPAGTVGGGYSGLQADQEGGPGTAAGPARPPLALRSPEAPAVTAGAVPRLVPSLHL